MVGLITKKVRKRLRPTITWLGGAACVPIAWRRRLSTITMRVKPVIIRSTAGRKLSAVKNSSVCTGTEKLVPPAPWPIKSGRSAAMAAHLGKQLGERRRRRGRGRGAWLHRVQGRDALRRHAQHQPLARLARADL